MSRSVPLDQITVRRKLRNSWNYSAEFTWCHGMPGWMMIVTMMTPRSSALDRATIVAIRHVFAAFHLMCDRIAKGSWTSLSVASHLAILTSAFDTFHFSMWVNSWMPLHSIFIGTTKGILAAAGSQYLLRSALCGWCCLISRQTSCITSHVRRARCCYWTLSATGLLARPKSDLLIAIQRWTLYSWTFHF